MIRSGAWSRGAAAAALLLALAMPADAARYEVRLDAETKHLAVHACRAQAAREVSLGAGEDAATAAIGPIVRSSGGTIEKDGQDWTAADWKADECLDYRVDLAALEHGDWRRLARVDGEWRTEVERWLWRFSGDEREDSEIRFVLPAGWSLSTPWKPLDAAPNRRFALGPISNDWPALVVFGHFDETPLPLPRYRLRPALLGQPDAATRDRLRRVLVDAAAIVNRSFPEVFSSEPQVVVMPVGRQKAPVVFGFVNRGGWPALNLLVDAGHDEAEFHGDWTTIHEMSHLIHPAMVNRGHWLAEGIATYFQVVLRARAGVIGVDEAWQEFDAGFERGRKDQTGRSVQEMSNGSSDGRPHFMRIYWSGAALMLLAELELQSGEQPTSLTAVLDRAYRERRDAGVLEMDPVEFMRSLDRIAGRPVFDPLRQRIGAGTTMPDLEAAYRRLGLVHDGATLRIRRDDADAVALRRAIMGGD
jgi:hypothetical protein